MSTDEAPNKTDRKLPRSGSGQTLQGIVGEDVDDLDIFGYEMIFTTGEFRVGRAELLAKAREVGIAEWMLPSQVAPHYAFGRAVSDLLNDREEIEVPVADDSAPIDKQRVQFELRRNDSNYSYTLDARAYLPPEMTQSDDGDWAPYELGVIKYEDGDIHFVDKIDSGKQLYRYWAAERDDNPLEGGFKQRFQALFEAHQESHTGKDVNNMTYYLVDQWTDSIKLRDACYFVPASHSFRRFEQETFQVPEGSEPGEYVENLAESMQDSTGRYNVLETSENSDGSTEAVAEVEMVRDIEVLVDAFQELYQWLNVQKRDQDSDLVHSPKFAQDTEMSVIEIMDTDRQRQMVERKVQDRLTDMADDVADDILDEMQDDDAVAADVADEVTDALQNLQAVAGEYDSLLGSEKAALKTQNAVKRAVRNALGDLETDQAEVVEKVLQETDEAPTPTA